MKRACVSVIFAGMHFRWGLRVVTGPVFHADRCGMRTLPEIWLLSPEIIDFCLGTARGRTSTSGGTGTHFREYFIEDVLLGIERLVI